MWDLTRLWEPQIAGFNANAFWTNTGRKAPSGTPAGHLLPQTYGGRRLLQVVTIRDPARDLSAHFSLFDLPVTPKGAGHTVGTGHTVAQHLSNFDLECEGSGEGAHISGWGIFLSRVLCSPGTDVPTCSEDAKNTVGLESSKETPPARVASQCG